MEARKKPSEKLVAKTLGSLSKSPLFEVDTSNKQKAHTTAKPMDLPASPKAGACLPRVGLVFLPSGVDKIWGCLDVF